MGVYLLSRSFLNSVCCCVCCFMLSVFPDIFINLLNFCKIVEKFKFFHSFWNVSVTESCIAERDRESQRVREKNELTIM